MPQITIEFVNLTFILSLPLPSTVKGAMPWYNHISADVTDVKQVKNKQVKNICHNKNQQYKTQPHRDKFQLKSTLKFCIN